MTMSERKTAEPPWSFPVAVADIPETGRHIDIVADDRTRAAIAEAADLAALAAARGWFRSHAARRRRAAGCRTGPGGRRAKLRGDAGADRKHGRRSNRSLVPAGSPRSARRGGTGSGRGGRSAGDTCRMAWSISVQWPPNFCFWESIPIPASPARYSRRRRQATRRAARLQLWRP